MFIILDQGTDNFIFFYQEILAGSAFDFLSPLKSFLLV
jgi:hypothetical protein